MTAGSLGPVVFFFITRAWLARKCHASTKRGGSWSVAFLLEIHSGRDNGSDI